MSTEGKSRRIIRDRNLTAEEAAKYAEIRRKVMEEFPPKNPNAKLGKQLKQIREKQGLTPEEVAQSAGLSDDDIQNAEQGREIPLSTFVHLADALGCELTLDSH